MQLQSGKHHYNGCQNKLTSIKRMFIKKIQSFCKKESFVFDIKLIEKIVMNVKYTQRKVNVYHSRCKCCLSR